LSTFIPRHIYAPDAFAAEGNVVNGQGELIADFAGHLSSLEGRGWMKKYFHRAGSLLAAMASEKIASISARTTAPTSLFSPGLLTTGTLRSSLASTAGNASSRRWPGVR